MKCSPAACPSRPPIPWSGFTAISQGSRLSPAERSKWVPAPVCAIILQLLAKTAEERYQTAGGVEADLRRCLAEWEARGRIDTFALGAHDTPDRLLLPEQLYGRDRERQVLLAAFDQVVSTGTPALVLVCGYSGIGKSSVVHELHKAIVLPRGIFISGKFDQYKRDIPYATLAQAFRTLIRQILSESEAQVEAWRKQATYGRWSEWSTHRQPHPGARVRHRQTAPGCGALRHGSGKPIFTWCSGPFSGCFADQKHPLAIFLDDLQWLDAATLKLLEHLTTHP